MRDTILRTLHTIATTKGISLDNLNNGKDASKLASSLNKALKSKDVRAVHVVNMAREITKQLTSKEKYTKKEMVDILRTLDAGPDSLAYSDVESMRVRDFLVQTWGLLGKTTNEYGSADTVHTLAEADKFDGDFRFATGYERTWMAEEFISDYSDETGWTDEEISALVAEMYQPPEETPEQREQSRLFAEKYPHLFDENGKFII